MLIGKLIPVILLLLVLIVGGSLLKNELLKPQDKAPIVLPQGGVCDPETLICSDGTNVKKQAPNCDFPPCPSGTASSSAVFNRGRATLDR